MDTLKNKLFETNSCEFLPKLYGVWKSVDEIDFDSLPNAFVLKTNHDCGGVVIVPDKKTLLNDTQAYQKAMQKLKEHLQTNYYELYREWHYKDIEARVFAEELLGADLNSQDTKQKQEQNSNQNSSIENDDFQGKIATESYKVPDDYKINQCHSHTLFVEVDSNRFSSHTRAMFDEHFVKLPFQFSAENLPITKSIEKPQGFDKLIIVAKILGSDLNYVRVDLYNVCSKIYVGELTFTPAGGTSKFYPNEWDKRFGEMWG